MDYDKMNALIYYQKICRDSLQKHSCSLLAQVLRCQHSVVSLHPVLKYLATSHLLASESSSMTFVLALYLLYSRHFICNRVLSAVCIVQEFAAPLIEHIVHAEIPFFETFVGRGIVYILYAYLKFGIISQIGAGITFAIGIVYILMQNKLLEMTKQQEVDSIASIPEPRTLASQYYQPNLSTSK
uniref:Uncharacterized protein n=1 Tax=Metopus es TaxID=392813 RepID=A6MI34_9CILI|nr:hypothetical protein [Metopus es]